MFSLITKSCLIFFLLPTLALAIEPTNPVELCDRLITEAEKSQCLTKTTPGQLDWYAASACGKLQEDKNFMNCLEQIKDSFFNPQALELCSRSVEMTDEARSSCLQKIKNKDYSQKQLKKCTEATSQLAIESCFDKSSLPRSPASQIPRGFQPL